MKNLIALISIVSSLAVIAEDQVAVPRKTVVLKSSKDFTQTRIQEELSKYYLSLLKSNSAIKAERDVLAKKLNDEMFSEVVSAEPFIYSHLKTGSDYRLLENYEGGKLKCKTIFTESHAYAVLEGQSWKRSSSIAFGARINLSAESCEAEAEGEKIKDKRVIVNLDYIDLFDLDKKFGEI